MELSEVDSADDACLNNNPLIFVDYKMMRMLEKKRQAKFCHILTSIVLDLETLKHQSFTRGEASVIFNECTDYWDGEKIEHISNTMRTDIKAILAQWNEQYETIGFSYKPITDEFNIQVLQKLQSNSEESLTKEQMEEINNFTLELKKSINNKEELK